MFPKYLKEIKYEKQDDNKIYLIGLIHYMDKWFIRIELTKMLKVNEKVIANKD